MYYIHFDGRWYEYGNIVDARARAEYILNRTGVIVSIVDKLP